MAIADDLLTLAGQLAAPTGGDPEQAWLRRSISTSYYAVFHLLVQNAARRWTGSQAEQFGLERTFKHEQMKEVSLAVATNSWKGWSMPSLAVPIELREVARAFVGLQEVRHWADYNNEKEWTKSEVIRALRAAREVFQNWERVSGSPVADEYLLSLMIGKKRR